MTKISQALDYVRPGGSKQPNSRPNLFEQAAPSNSLKGVTETPTTDIKLQRSEGSKSCLNRQFRETGCVDLLPVAAESGSFFCSIRII